MIFKTSLAVACLAGAFLASPGIAIAQTPPMPVPPAPTTDPAKVESGHFAIDPMHTVAVFGINHMGFSTYYGHFTDITGTLELDAKKPATSKLEIHVPIKSLSTPSEKLNGELVGEKWFDAGKYPEMTFVSTKISVKSGGKALVQGNLTLHGVTKPLTLMASLHGAGMNTFMKKYTVGFDVSGHIKRSDFGISAYVPLIGDDVQLIISAAFEKQS